MGFHFVTLETRPAAVQACVMSSLTILLILLTQAAPAAQRQMIVTPEGLQVQASSRARDHARQIEVAQQLWREVCVERQYGVCAAPDHYTADVNVSEDTSSYCSGVLRLSRTAPEYPSGAGALAGVQFHCFGEWPEEKRRIATIQLPNAETMYLDWPPMPEIS